MQPDATARVRCDGCGAPTKPDVAHEYRTNGGTVYRACSNACLDRINDAVDHGRPLASPSPTHPWVVHTGSVATTAWCTTFADAVRFAAVAPGARIEGPWMELLDVRADALPAPGLVTDHAA